MTWIPPTSSTLTCRASRSSSWPAGTGRRRRTVCSSRCPTRTILPAESANDPSASRAVRGARERHLHRRSIGGRRHHFDGAAVGDDDLARDEEAEPEALRLL